MRKDLRKCANDDLNDNKAANTDEAELLLGNISSAVETVTENLKTFVQCINESIKILSDENFVNNLN